jgi:hypothetical protein
MDSGRFDPPHNQRAAPGCSAAPATSPTVWLTSRKRCSAEGSPASASAARPSTMALKIVGVMKDNPQHCSTGWHVPQR